MKHNYRKLHSQKGLSLIVLVLILIITGSAIYISQLNANNIRAMRSQATANALAKAKDALLGYAVTESLKVYPSTPCPISCSRPGDLPCPDTDNDGESQTACNAAASRLGLLPWKTLGLGDLRDGNGDRLWYAVSTNFKNNPKVMPLNNDTKGTLNVANSAGILTEDSTNGTGAVAVIFSPGAPLTRQDGLEQIRSNVNISNPLHYLDNAVGEDNASFVDSSVNGFIKGPILNANGDTILNDQVMVISAKDLFSVIDAKVLKEVKNALAQFNNDNGYYPNAAEFSDQSCLGTISGIDCQSIPLLFKGRIPASLLLASWDSDSILRSSNINNWFQQNGWREHIYYAVSSICTLPLVCASGGMNLTLNGAINGAVNKNVVLLMAGPTVLAQSRNNNVQKTIISNYFEQENASVSDDVFLRALPLTNTFNDSAESVP
jgi:hypothetical protein